MHRPRLSAVVAVVLALIVSAGTSALGQTADEARNQREATRGEQARVGKELDAARAEESQIRAALDGLDQALEFQQGQVDEALQALEAAQTTVIDRERVVAETTARIAVVRARAKDTIVDSYIGGVGSSADQWLASRDATEVSQRRQLLDAVRGGFAQDLELLRRLGQDQERAKSEAAAAVKEALKQEVALSAARAELQSQRDAQARLENALRGRIGDYEAEAARLKAAEDELTAVINRHLAEEAAAAARAAGAAAPGEVPLPKLTAASAGGFIVPTDGDVTSPFGYRRHPILGSVRLHAGTDFGAGYGAPIWASKGGEVIFAGWNGGYGNCVIIAHDGGISTLYGHQSEIVVSEGQYVGQGEVIGYVGSTGQSTGAHLHFEVRVGGEPTDPMLFL